MFPVVATVNLREGENGESYVFNYGTCIYCPGTPLNLNKIAIIVFWRLVYELYLFTVI